jgi:predicted secreted protein
MMEHSLTTLFHAYADQEKPPVIELLNIDRKPVGAIYFDKFKYKNFIQAILAMVIVFISWHPKVYLHPITVAILICTCYTLHTYIDNKSTLNKLQFKYSKQEEIIFALYKNSEELIHYRDINGNYIYCNPQ